MTANKDLAKEVFENVSIGQRSKSAKKFFYRVSQQVLDEEAVTENFKNTQNLNFGFVVKKFVKLKRDLHYLARM